MKKGSIVFGDNASDRGGRIIDFATYSPGEN
jgi:hypothetical protein